MAVDIRGGDSIAMLPQQLDSLRAQDLELKFLFLDAKNEILIKRFSETRRTHPLARDGVHCRRPSSRSATAWKVLTSLGHHIDTSDIAAATLREWVRQFIEAEPGQGWC